MDLEQLLRQLEQVRKSRKGYMARCPAHEDRSPSLSIRGVDDRILVHCFGGCNVSAICKALGITVGDLFARPLPSSEMARLHWIRMEQKQAQQKQRIHEGRTIDARREAEALLVTCRGQNLFTWTNERFDRVMNAVGQALVFLRDEDEENFYEHIGRTTKRIWDNSTKS